MENGEDILNVNMNDLSNYLSKKIKLKLIMLREPYYGILYFFIELLITLKAKKFKYLSKGFQVSKIF